MKINQTKLPGVCVIDAGSFNDHRGSFSRWYCARELAPVLGGKNIVQVNHSVTSKTGTIRGMHFQKSPHQEMKLVRCIHGRVWDVALDLRAESPTFLRWHAEELSAENNHMLVVPEGCAHGFQALEPDSELLYLHTNFFEPSSEGGVNYADPLTKIEWPLPAKNLSDRDAGYPFLTGAFRGI